MEKDSPVEEVEVVPEVDVVAEADVVEVCPTAIHGIMS